MLAPWSTKYSRSLLSSVHFIKMSSSVATGSAPSCVTPERMKELTSALDGVRVRIRQAAEKAPPELRHINPVLVAVSKYKPAEDVLACFEHGQRDFGENYVAELSEKAAVLPTDIRWHFIGTLQSNKCKPLAAIPNLFAIQTLDTTKKATTLNNALPTSRIDPLHVFIQVNTSSEANKSGLPPISSDTLAPEASELAKLALHVINDCDRLHLRGLMTIGSIEQSTSSGPNEDFSALVYTANALQNILPKDRYGWGVEGKLELSMGMSADFEQAIRAGAGTVRVGTSIFGSRKTKAEVAQS